MAGGLARFYVVDAEAADDVERGSWAAGLHQDIEDDFGPARKHAADTRLKSAFARFCRRHSIGELPQLWHVVHGEMSLIGPRPLTLRELREFYGETAETPMSRTGCGTDLDKSEDYSPLP